MTCPWRKLEADGRIVECTGHGSICEPGFPDHVSGGYVGGVATEDWAGPQVMWDDDDPCAWDATTVDGVPPRLIGVGTVLRERSGRELMVMYVDTAPAETILHCREFDRGKPALRRSSEVGVTIDVVRAVPPATDRG